MCLHVIFSTWTIQKLLKCPFTSWLAKPEIVAVRLLCWFVASQIACSCLFFCFSSQTSDWALNSRWIRPPVYALQHRRIHQVTILWSQVSDKANKSSLLMACIMWSAPQLLSWDYALNLQASWAEIYWKLLVTVGNFLIRK